MLKRNISFLEGINLTGLPIITFKCEDKVLAFVLDTGSNRCYIDKEVIKYVPHTYKEQEDIILTSGAASQQSGIATINLQHKGHIFDLDCCVLDMSEAFSGIKASFGVTLHGLIGTDFFEKYKYVLDFDSMVAYSLKK